MAQSQRIEGVDMDALDENYKRNEANGVEDSFENFYFSLPLSLTSRLRAPLLSLKLRFKGIFGRANRHGR